MNDKEKNLENPQEKLQEEQEVSKIGKTKTKKKPKKWVIVLGVLIAISLIGALFSGPSEEEPTEDATKELSVEEAEENLSSLQAELDSELDAELSKAETTKAETTKATTTKAQATGGVRPEFREAMESYEAFFDEYIAFMQKYQSSNDPISMMNDYASYMNRYADTMAKMNAIDESTLTSEETALYLETTSRISQKLLSTQ